MGSLARSHRRRQARTLRLPDRWYGTAAGWCATEDDLPEARKQTHDTLISLMAERRVGAVQWRWWTGHEASEALRLLSSDVEGHYGQITEHAAYYDQIAALLRDHGGFLVVAMAPGKRP